MKTGQYVLFYIATHPGGRSYGQGHVNFDSNGMQGNDWLAAAEAQAQKRLIEQGEVPPGSKLVATGWQRFDDPEVPEDKRTDADKLGQVVQEGMETRYYTRERVFVLRTTFDSAGVVPAWCFERCTNPTPP
jgi:hypothetical protein